MLLAYRARAPRLARHPEGAFRRTGPRGYQSGELVQKHVDVADWLEAEALEDRARHRAALCDQRRRTACRGLVPARAQKRPVGTAATGSRDGCAAVEQQAVWCRRACPCATISPSSQAACMMLGASRHRCASSARASATSSSGISNACHCTSFPAVNSSNVSTRRATIPGTGAAAPQSRRARLRMDPCPGRAHARAADRPGSAAAPSCRPPTASCCALARAAASAPPRGRRRLPPRRSAVAGRCSTSCRAPCTACSGRSRSARRPARSARRSSGTPRSLAARAGA